MFNKDRLIISVLIISVGLFIALPYCIGLAFMPEQVDRISMCFWGIGALIISFLSALLVGGLYSSVVVLIFEKLFGEKWWRKTKGLVAALIVTALIIFIIVFFYGSCPDKRVERTVAESALRAENFTLSEKEIEAIIFSPGVVPDNSDSIQVWETEDGVFWIRNPDGTEYPISPYSKMMEFQAIKCMESKAAELFVMDEPG